MSRVYYPFIVDQALLKAKLIPRSEALKRVLAKTLLERVVFAVECDPRLPALSNLSVFVPTIQPRNRIFQK